MSLFAAKPAATNIYIFCLLKEEKGTIKIVHSLNSVN